VSEPKPKSFDISKRAVWEAYRRVKANKGAAGVDERKTRIVYCKDADRFGSHEHEPTQPRRADVSRVLVSAIDDQEYARNLMLCKDTPPLRDFLPQNPPRRAEAPAADGEEDKSTRELLQSASSSFWAWTRSGFAIVDKVTYGRRFGACQECPHLVEPPGLVSKLIDVARNDDDRKICELCGCVASKKAHLPRETCPAPHPQLEWMSRWKEPIAPKDA
jgi:hypothetical protein